MIKKRSNRWLIAITTATLAVAIAWTFVASDIGDSDSRDRVQGTGLVVEGAREQTVSMAVDAGGGYSFGTLYLRNASTSPLVLAGVHFIRPTDGLDVVGALALPADNPYGVGTDRFPPNLVPSGQFKLQGTTVAAGESIQIIVGFKVARDGVFQSDALGVDYREGNLGKTQQFGLILKACAPRRTYSGICSTAQVASTGSEPSG